MTYKEIRREVLVGKSNGKKNNLEYLVLYGIMILKRILNKQDRRVEWFDLAKDRDKWRAIVNVVMNLQVP
jgi:hypothetical protein